MFDSNLLSKLWGARFGAAISAQVGEAPGGAPWGKYALLVLQREGGRVCAVGDEGLLLQRPTETGTEARARGLAAGHSQGAAPGGAVRRAVWSAVRGV